MNWYVWVFLYAAVGIFVGIMTYDLLPYVTGEDSFMPKETIVLISIPLWPLVVMGLFGLWLIYRL